MAFSKYGLDLDKEARKNEKFNKLLNLYYQDKINFSDNNTIYIRYKTALEELRRLVRYCKKFPSVKEWDIYAKKNGFLSSESIKYIAGINWQEIRGNIK